MSILFFGNNRMGLDALRHLIEVGDRPVGLAIHPPGRARFRTEMLESAGLPDTRVFEGPQLREPDTLARIAALKPDLGICVLYGYIFRPELLRLFRRGVVNLHPSLLPWNRGAFPNVWSLAEETPAGVTLHWIDEGVDTGDIIAQREVPVEPVDTGATLYRKLEAAGLRLLAETWTSIREGSAPRHPQEPGVGTYHRTVDISGIDRIELDAPTTAREVLNRLRALTFRPYESAWFRAANGRRVYARVDLEYGPEPTDAVDTTEGEDE